MLKVRTFPIGPLEVNCYLVSNRAEAVVVDPGGDPAPILRILKSDGLKLTHIIDTHLHFDHIYGNSALAKATGAPILAGQADAFLLETEIGKGGLMVFPRVEDFDFESLKPGETTFLDRPCKVLPTPGHSPGSLSLYFPQDHMVFSGDLIFYRSIGRTDFPGGDYEQLLESVRREIFTLPGETVIYSGHGPKTTVGDEKMHNPFFHQTRLLP